MKKISLLPLIGVLAILAALGWQLSHPMPEISADTKPLPEVNLPSALHSGGTLTNADFTAKLNVVNVFASWCAPCLAELPMLADIAKLDDVKVYGIAWHDKDEALKPWISKNSPPFADIGSDMDGSVAIALGIHGVPESFFLDHDGNIVYHHAGAITEEDMQNVILPLIRQYTGKN